MGFQVRSPRPMCILTPQLSFPVTVGESFDFPRPVSSSVKRRPGPPLQAGGEE